MNVEAFRNQVRKYLRAGGYQQNELAGAIGLHPKVLSRKLHGNANAQLTQREIRDILMAFARWHIIATREEALHLLAVAEVDPGIFRADEWQAPPLSELTGTGSSSTIVNQAAQTPRHNLPAPTTQLIGRTWAVERLQYLLSNGETRLVTLVGPGGSGKTLLALHVAGELINTFAQGVWFVPLAGVSDPALVPISIVQALNLKSTPDLTALQRLIEHLREKHLLLVLDNFEHLSEARSTIDALLAAAPKLKVLLTSRVVQRLYGEREFRVPPLDIPDLNMPLDTSALAQYGAIQLFLERAQAVMPDFALTDANAPLIAQICAMVDGLPLAIELAAPRIKVLPPEGLLARLTQARLSVLTGGAKNLPDRQHTLRKTIDWSYTLLTSSEKMWFRRLGAVIGGWELETAEAMMLEMTADEDHVSAECDSLDLLEQLVDNSLIVRLPVEQEQGLARFTMLSTLREYALEQLATHHEDEWLRDWHACYYLRKAEIAELGLRGPQQLTYLAQLLADRGNFRAALEWSLQKARAGLHIHSFAHYAQTTTNFNPEVAGSTTLPRQHIADEELPALAYCLRLAAALRHCWEWQGDLTEGRYWLNAVLSVPFEPESSQVVLAARAKALSEAARLVFLQNEKIRALELVEESIALWRQLDDPRGLATALLHRGWVAHGMGEYEAAKQFYQEGIDLLSPTEESWIYAQLLFHLGAAAGFTSDFELTQSCYTRSRELFGRIGDQSSVADTWKDQGGILLLQSKWTEALDCLLKSIQLSQKIGHKQFLATALGLVSYVVGLREEPDPETASLDSAQMKGAADNLFEMIGLSPWTRTNDFAQMVRQLIRSRVDDQRWEAAWHAGHSLTLEQAIELAYRLGKGTIGE